MKKLTLCLIILEFSMISLYSQESSTAKNKYSIGAGATYSTYGYGGLIAAEYLLSQKFSLGLKCTITPYKNPNYTLTNVIRTYKPDLSVKTDINLLYYLIGNNSESKAGLYIEIGIGYQADRLSSTVEYIPNPTYSELDITRGLESHFNLGGSYKIGNGKLFLEAGIGGIVSGSSKTAFDYPSGYSGSTTPNYTQSGATNTDIYLNLGYKFNF